MRNITVGVLYLSRNLISVLKFLFFFKGSGFKTSVITYVLVFNSLTWFSRARTPTPPKSPRDPLFFDEWFGKLELGALLKETIMISAADYHCFLQQTQ